MRRPLSPTLLVVLALLAAGCVSKEDPAAPQEATDPTPEPDVRPASTSNATAPTPAANATGNSTASANSTKPSDMPSDPSNCMRGMDMEGCTAAQADAYFDARKANAPPPDKELPPVVILLDAQGANPGGAFTLDAGTMTLLVEIYLNDTGMGPYAALGPDGAGDLQLSFVGPTGTETIAIGGLHVGVNPADSLAQLVKGSLDMPTIGDWTIALEGQGVNAQLEIRLIERFYM